MLKVDILALLAAVAPEVEQPLLGVHIRDAAGAEQAARDGVLKLAFAVVQIKVPPSASLRPPDHLVGIFEVRNGLEVDVGVLEAFDNQAFGFAGFRVNRAELDGALESVAAQEAQLVGGFAPV